MAIIESIDRMSKLNNDSDFWHQAVTLLA